MSVVPIKSLFNHGLSSLSVLLSRFGIAYTAPMPTFLSVEPSAVCQLHCPQCPCGQGVNRRTNSAKMMTLPTFYKVLSDCAGWVHTIQFYFQGEPLLNTDLPAMITLAHQAHVYTTCSTNALALTPRLATQIMQSGLDRIIVSIDGLSEESYQTYRVGGTLHQALTGLKCLRQAKDQLGAHTHIELQCLRLRSNQHEWSLFQRSYRQMGADSLTLKTAQFYHYQHGNPLMPVDEQYNRYHRLQDGTYVPKNRLKPMINRPCSRLLTGCIISVNGDILPCCFDKDRRYVMGNIHAASLASIWKSKVFSDFRSKVQHDRMQLSMCQNCSE